MQLSKAEAVLLLGLSLVVAVPTLIIGAAFTYGLVRFPREEAPLWKPSTQAMQALWLDVGGRGSVPTNSRSTFQTLSTLANYFRARRENDPVRGLAGQVAKAQLAERYDMPSRKLWNLAGFAGAFYVLNSWKPEEMAAYLERKTYFGENIRGFEQASEVFFGAPISTLNNRQVISLAIVMRSPRAFDPWCRFESFAAFAARHYDMQVTSPATIQLAQRSLDCE